jgi:CCR4-NOT transcriptional regulation complex NOT5 subunit
VSSRSTPIVSPNGQHEKKKKRCSHPYTHRLTYILSHTHCSFEAEIELGSSGKKSKKKSGPSDKEARLKEVIERHQHHITKLEMLMRMIDKCAETDPDLDKRIEEALSDDLR